MKPAPFSYRAPETVEECVQLLHEEMDSAKVMAGGQSLVPMLNLRLAVPEVIVDVSRVGELIATRELADGCGYGASTVHSAIEDSVVPDVTNGLMASAAAGIGYRAIRNRGTIGGSMAHADSSAEWPIVLAAVNARILCTSTRGTRTVPARGFVQAFFTNALDDDELLTQIQVPAFGAARRWGLHKQARKPGEFAESIGVVVLTAEDAATPARDVEVWLGGAGDAPCELSAVADLLSGRPVAEVDKGEVVAAVADGLPAARTDEERYRSNLHGITVWRALKSVRWLP